MNERERIIYERYERAKEERNKKIKQKIEELNEMLEWIRFENSGAYNYTIEKFYLDEHTGKIKYTEEEE